METNGGLPLSQAIAFDPAKLKITKASPDEINSFNESIAKLYQSTNVAESQPHAVVKRGNETIATLDNNGFVQSSNAMGGQILQLVKGDSGQGPQLAESRAQKIATFFGGTVEKLPTAQTQSEWNNRAHVTWSVDYDAMARHGYNVPENVQQKSFSSSLLANETIMSILDRGLKGELS